MNGLAALYSVVCLAGLLTELNWTGKRWMPFVAPLNTAMALIWVVVLVTLASPLVNPWELSARSQEARLMQGRVKAEEFDFGYLRFSLGKYGDQALERLAAVENHPQAAEIRAGVARARSAVSPWDYANGDAADAAAETDSEEAVETEAPPGLMDLPLNPGSGAVEEPADETSPPPESDATDNG
jgi:hypothetical protein